MEIYHVHVHSLIVHVGMKCVGLLLMIVGNIVMYQMIALLFAQFVMITVVCQKPHAMVGVKPQMTAILVPVLTVTPPINNVKNPVEESAHPTVTAPCSPTALYVHKASAKKQQLHVGGSAGLGWVIVTSIPSVQLAHKLWFQKMLFVGIAPQDHMHCVIILLNVMDSSPIEVSVVQSIV